MNRYGVSLHQSDQERFDKLLGDTVTMLCKNGLQYTSDLRIQGLIGVTVDGNQMFLIQINKWVDTTGSSLMEPTGQTLSTASNQNCIKTEQKSADSCASDGHSSIDVAAAGSLRLISNESAAGVHGEDDEMLMSYGSYAEYEGADEAFEVNQTGSPAADNATFHKQVAVLQPEITMGRKFKARVKGNAPLTLPEAEYSGLQTSNDWGMYAGDGEWTDDQYVEQPKHCAQSSSSFNSKTSRNQWACGGSTMQDRRDRNTSIRQASSSASMVRQGTIQIPKDNKQTKIQVKENGGFSYGKMVEMSYVCNLCGKRFRHQCSLLTHQVRIHGREKKKNMGRRPIHSLQ
jgi:hypothetical protein